MSLFGGCFERGALTGRGGAVLGRRGFEPGVGAGGGVAYIWLCGTGNWEAGGGGGGKWRRG